MDTRKIDYRVLNDEFHGLVIQAKKENKNFKLFVSNDLLGQNNLAFWEEPDYYKDFIDKNIESFVKDIEDGNCRQISDGYSID